MKPDCDTVRERQHKLVSQSTYRIYFISTQTSLLDFLHAHPHHLRNVVFVHLVIRQGNTKNQVRISTGTIVTMIESEWRDRKGKSPTERRSQIGCVCSTQGLLNFCPSTLCQVVMRCACYAACRVKFREITQRPKGITGLTSYRPYI